VSLHNLVSLFKITGDINWENRAQSVIKAFTGSIKAQPSAFTYFLNGLDFAFGPSVEVVIAGEPEDMNVQKMIKAINKAYLPKTVVLLKSTANASKLCQVAAFTDALKPVAETATAYVCTNLTCSQPTNDVQEMMETLQGLPA
jgi:uncharacterized protein YyaL (SSP411 family)